MASPSSAPFAACRHRTMRFGSHGQPPLRARRSGQRIRGPSRKWAEWRSSRSPCGTPVSLGQTPSTFPWTRTGLLPSIGLARYFPCRYKWRRHPGHRPDCPGRLGSPLWSRCPFRQASTSEIRTRRKSTLTSLLDPTTAKAACCQGVVPAPFMQTYTQSQAPKIAFHRPTSLTTQLAAPASGYSPVVATAPNGNIVQVWSGPSRTNGNRYRCRSCTWPVWDSQGNLVTPARLVDDLSAATLRTSDSTPALAISPDGRIGVIWHRSVRDSNSDIKENIFFQSLTADGVATTGPVNLTNNTVFGRPYSYLECAGFLRTFDCGGQ